jgi:hypothetical protein
VAVEALYVRDEPSFSGNVLGVVPYNQSLYPVGRNGDATWISVNWGSVRGWVYGGYVAWDPNLNLTTLPVLVEATGIPISPTPGEVATAAETQTLEVAATPSPPPTPTLAPTLTPETITRTVTAVPSTKVTPAPTPAGSKPATPAGGDPIPANARLPLLGGLGFLVLAGLLYGWQWSAGRAQVKRYAGGFILSVCPVCQEGHIHLDEVVRKSLGIQRVRRSARCDTCRSVLRELRPGVWRYLVDAAVNPELAERFKTRRVTAADLQELAQHVVLKPSPVPVDEPTDHSLNLKWLEIEEPLPADDADADQDNQPDAS